MRFPAIMINQEMVGGTMFYVMYVTWAAQLLVANPRFI